eukprot:GHVR01108148.1.p1 GENE.GHVR01108148.1~~GHVR01108148.1.p1  ORF type:complete len:327 (+),score=42.97 GHVR01108148.1:701-1681(+)
MYMALEEGLTHVTYIKDDSLSSWRKSFFDQCDSTCEAAVADSKFGVQVSAFLDGPRGAPFRGHVRIEGNKVKQSRFGVVSKPTTELGDLGEMMLAVRAVVDDTAAQFKDTELLVYTESFFFFEQFVVIKQQTALSLGLSVAGVAVISALFIGPGFTLPVILLVISLVDSLVIGYMSWWGISLDSVSFVNLVMAVGFVVDYTAHIAHSFENVNLIHAPGESASERRARKAIISLQTVGVSVFYGGTSSLLATIPLAFSTSYIFFTFFRLFFLTIFFGLAHGLILMPVVLALIGPAGLPKKQRSYPTYRACVSMCEHVFGWPFLPQRC